MTKEYITVEQAEVIAKKFVPNYRNFGYVIDKSDFHQALNLAIEQTIGDPVAIVQELGTSKCSCQVRPSSLQDIESGTWLYALNKDKP